MPGRLNRGVFHATNDRLFFATRSEGGVWQDSGSRYGEAAFLYMPHSAVFITCKSARHIARKEKSCAESDPPPKPGGHAVLKKRCAVACLYSAPWGSLSSSFIPAGRLGTATPLSPRASSCRIGPRRQGFASPLRALDGSGPIRKTRCLRGERGGAGRGVRGRASA